MTKQLVLYATAVMTTLLALVVLWQFRIVVVYVLISLMLAAALRPLANRLVERSIAIRLLWILLYLLVLGCFGFLFFLSIENAIYEIQLFAQTVSVQDKWILPVWLEGSLFQHSLVTQLPPPSKLFEAFTGSQGQFVLPALLGFTQGIGGLVSDTLVILFLSIYWSISQIHFERLWLSLLPSGLRRQARGIWRKVEPDLGAYVRGQVFQSLIAGLLFGLGYWLIGSPYPILLALTGAVACLIPVVGVVLAVIPPLLMGLFTSVQLSLFTGVYTLVVLIILGVWVKPWLFNRKWDNPILTLVLLIALSDAFGFIGILIAPPLSIVCQILWSRLISHRAASRAAAQVSDLKARHEHVRDIIMAMEEPHLPLVTSSMERLSLLMERAEPILQETIPGDPTEVLNRIMPLPGQENRNVHT